MLKRLFYFLHYSVCLLKGPTYRDDGDMQSQTSTKSLTNHKTYSNRLRLTLGVLIESSSSNMVTVSMQSRTHSTKACGTPVSAARRRSSAGARGAGARQRAHAATAPAARCRVRTDRERRGDSSPLDELEPTKKCLSS